MIDTNEAELCASSSSDLLCTFCDDGAGNSVFPYYGVAPHTHWREKGNGDSVYSSAPIIKQESEWPDNFRKDADNPNCGTYTHCPFCSAGA